jgi:hypothetical protein
MLHFDSEMKPKGVFWVYLQWNHGKTSMAYNEDLIIAEKKLELPFS